MSTLTKKQTTTLIIALWNLELARAYLYAPDIAIALKGKPSINGPAPATTTLHYTRADGCTLYEVEKAYGSDLTGLDNAIHTLCRFLGFSNEREG